MTILRKKFSLPIEVAARRDGGIEVYDIGNNATLADYANTTDGIGPAFAGTGVGNPAPLEAAGRSPRICAR